MRGPRALWLQCATENVLICCVCLQVHEILGDKATLYERDVGHVEAHKTGHAEDVIAPVVAYLQDKLGLPGKLLPLHLIAIINVCGTLRLFISITREKLVTKPCEYVQRVLEQPLTSALVSVIIINKLCTLSCQMQRDADADNVSGDMCCVVEQWPTRQPWPS